MLELRNITKTYIVGELHQDALKDVSVSFRESEFVSILGHSGSGKTTMLNIIGGLDQYTSGDLIINGVSTKKYKDKDWDAYRNHSIGFVFQNYNLIPHQTVLANVELALTLSGVSKEERKIRATAALEKVGLIEHIYKKPNQLSGGQAQRVAIARALVNNPEILLADEPTGALDSETSVQVMDILKEVSRDRLVIMVTHNPELAKQYSSRIIKLVDGKITEDTKPFNNKMTLKDKVERTKNKSMSFFTALSLSLNNLLTKKLRTFMTSFAGSIGIMGIALILSVSTGFQQYIDKVEEDTLSSYPLMITSETADATGAILSLITDSGETDGTDIVNEKQYISTMFSSIGTNDLKSFKKYIEDNTDKLEDSLTLIKYDYSVVPNIYGIDSTNSITKLNPNTMMNMMTSSSSASLLTTMSSTSGIFNEMVDDYEMLETNYDVLAGRWPSNYNEMIIVLSEPNSISDLLTYSLGLRDFEELKTIITEVMSGKEVSIKNESLKLTYDDLLNLEYKLINPSDLYKYNSKYDIYEDMSDDKEFVKKVYEKSEVLKIVGIVCKKASVKTMTLYPGVNYTKELTRYVIAQASSSEIVKKQLADQDIDIFSGKKFDSKNKDNNELDFQDMITVDEKVLKKAFKLNIDTDSMNQDTISQIVSQYMMNMISGLTTNIAPARSDLDTALFKLCSGIINYYCDNAEQNEGMITFNDTEIGSLSASYLTGSEFTSTIKAINDKYLMSQDVLTPVFQGLVPNVLNVLKATVTTPVPTAAIKMNADNTANLYISSIMNMDTSAPSYNAATDPNIIFNSLAEGLTTAKMAGIIVTNTTNMSTDLLAPFMAMFSSKDLMSIDTDMFAKAFKFNMNQDDLSRLMTTMLSSTDDKTYKSNLLALGYQDLDDPTMISFYFNNFDSKEAFVDFVDEYNDRVDEDKQISYTDVTGILMGSVSTIIDAVTYVLIAFVSISLVVSTIMIGVITLISVMERTKEIGILRAIGASKKDVGSVFNAETFIVGLLSGIIGIVGSELLLIPINALLHKVTKLPDLSAILPAKSGIVLIIISVVLTLISGLIPSGSASRKNPVEALRTE